ncbi:hypothetical protein BTM119_15140 [Helicobacter pylori]
MRQKNETATSFNQLNEITQAIQVQKTAHKLAITPTQASLQAKSTPKPKMSARAKNSALKPTKKAFSERQKTTIRDNSQASAKECLRSPNT